MSDPGWYNAQGDPPGTQRYWDGGQWIGEPVYEPPTTAGAVGLAPASPPADNQFPGPLKAVAIIVSVLKAIPLALGFVFVLLLLAFSNEFDDSFNDSDWSGIDDLLDAAAVFLGVFLLIGAVLLGFQFIGALRERPMWVLVPAIIMSILDVLAAISGWIDVATSGDDPFDSSPVGGAVLITAIAAAQVFVAVQAWKANKS